MLARTPAQVVPNDMYSNQFDLVFGTSSHQNGLFPRGFKELECVNQC